MPSIALFIKELLAEEKYDGTFSSKIQERIEELNAAQLQGLYNHLVLTANQSKTALWRNSNQEIVEKIRETLEVRLKQAEAERRVLEEYKLQQKQKRIAAQEIERERKRVMEMIAEKAHNQAVTEVRDQEAQREVKEKVEVIQKVFRAEERRNRWLIRITLTLVLGCVVVGVVGSLFLNLNILFILAAIAAILIISSILCVYAIRFTRIKARQVLPSELEEQIAAREEALQEEARAVLREKEKHFQEQTQRDKIERRKRKQQRREQQAYEHELMEQQRLERIAMAREIMARRNGGSSVGSGNQEHNDNDSLGTAEPDHNHINPFVHEDMQRSSSGGNHSGDIELGRASRKYLEQHVLSDHDDLVSEEEGDKMSVESLENVPHTERSSRYPHMHKTERRDDAGPETLDETENEDIMDVV